MYFHNEQWNISHRLGIINVSHTWISKILFYIELSPLTGLEEQRNMKILVKYLQADPAIIYQRK